MRVFWLLVTWFDTSVWCWCLSAVKNLCVVQIPSFYRIWTGRFSPFSDTYTVTCVTILALKRSAEDMFNVLNALHTHTHTGVSVVLTTDSSAQVHAEWSYAESLRMLPDSVHIKES